jgi:hypothetical protein
MWKEITSIFKSYEGIWKAVFVEGFYLMLGIALEGGKGLGWKGYLFVWPFVAAFGIGALLLIWAVLRPFIF